MEPIDFVIAVRKSIIDSNLEIYYETFNNTQIEKVTDPYWKKALLFFNNLNPAQKEFFFEIIKQIEIDTVSNFLGILDGHSALENHQDEFRLFANDNKKINGDLQDIFLQLHE